VGTRPGSSVLVVTTGLVQRLDPVQLEGVLAHELTHMKHGDVAVGTVAAAVVLPLAGMIDLGGVVHHLRGRGTELLTDRRAVGVTRYPPALRSALAIMVGSGSEPAAAVAGPHRPPSSEPAGTAHPGAAHASSSDGVGTAPGGASGLAATAAGRATRWLWTVALGPSPQGPALIGELDAPEVRMAALDEL
ncbi:MAG: M48 family metalloprotease, partial [Actinomycetota bacterium]|nr:M48 family metalloprotease [Actinomycetota bacterium]